jgi:predicted dehydrogenase
VRSVNVRLAGSPKRYAVVGTGARAEMFVRSLVTEHAATAELVAFADISPVRMDAHNRWLGELGHPPVPTYPLGDDPVSDFVTMLDKERVDVAIVLSMDATHDAYIVAALGADRDVLTEKPMTVDAARVERILRAERASAGRVTVTFNYRYNPVHEEVRRRLAGGEIGEIGSVHFEWLLDVRHGADYFRRWHRDVANSGGLLVHKASHHFDLVRWWLGADPVEVYAQTRLFFYGPEGGHGYDRGYERAHGDPAAADDPFALSLADHPRLRALYLDAEGDDGYLRDRNVFAPGVTITDDMAVLVRYASGATMSYHLNAYAPWEGYRLMVNGSQGRLELEVVENQFVSREGARTVKGSALHGVEAAAESGHTRLTIHPFWAPPRAVELPGLTRTGHGGADARMTATLFGSPAADPLARSATAVDGALAVLTGVAANTSAASGQPTRIADLVDPALLTARPPAGSAPAASAPAGSLAASS